MVETTEKTGEKKLSIAPTKTLTLKPRGAETGVVRQSFSHGRTKTVLVEKVKSRAPSKAREAAPAAAGSAATPAKAAAPAKAGAAASAATAAATTQTQPGAATKPSG